jgi:class 3 adenylate cyclase
VTSDHLTEWARHIERLRWAALILDGELRLAYVSDELKQFIGADDGDDLGMGLHIAEALTRDPWLRTVEPDSQIELAKELVPFILTDLEARGLDPKGMLPEQFHSILGTTERAEIPVVSSSSFVYVDPRRGLELPPHRVNMLLMRLNGDSGESLGALVLFFMDVRPNLQSLLARGDEQMYERMARLIEPGPQQAGILFCDLHQSGSIARQLSTAAYFKLVRRLWTGIDVAVAEEEGIVGKHAGDGASAFFLVGDLDDPSASAAATVRTARRIHEISEGVFNEVMEGGCRMKVGLHWGGSLYMGQLVPGGRLDVTALGDEVNEAARIQECADPHGTLASKQLLERLSPDDAASLGIDLEKLTYTPLAEVPSATAKAIDNAGAIPVTSI